MTLLALAAAWLVGVYLGVRLDVPPAALALFATTSILLSALLVSARRAPLATLLLLLLVLGALRVELSNVGAATPLETYHGRRSLEVQGVVIGDPEPAGAATRFRLSVDHIRPDSEWLKESGDVLVTLRESSELARQRKSPYVRYGDRLLLEGVLQAPPALDDFDYPAYLARQGIRSVMSFPEATLLSEGEGIAFYRWLYGVRRSISDSLATLVPEPQASVGQALLLGMRENLPESLVDEFRVTGTSHLLAISGLHVGILLGLSLAVSLRVLGRRGQHYLIAPLGFMWLYAFLAGMSPSVARAAIMGSVYLAALALGRPRSVLPALGLSAAVMVALNPLVLWSVSFQLSFAAMAGIALMAEPIASWLRALLGERPEEGVSRIPLLTALADAAAMAIAATVATLPLAAFYFQRVSLVGLPATVLSIPALPLVLVTQAAAGVLGLFVTVVALPFGWMAWAATSYLTGVVGLFSRLPGASFDAGRIAPILVFAYYGLFFLGYLVRPLLRSRLSATRQTRLPTLPSTAKGVPWWVLAPAIVVAALLWTAALSPHDGRLHVTFADVGEGDSVFIVTPGGRNILVDGGPDPMAAARILSERLPFWDRSIDLLVLTHPHSDHVAGLTEVLRRYEVEAIVEREVEYDSSQYHAWRQAVENEGAVVIQAQSGQVIDLKDGAYMHVVNPPERLLRGSSSDVDNASVVLRLVYGEVSFLLAADIFSEAERGLVARAVPIDSEVLKVAHHGSRTSSTGTFLDAVSPAVAIISVGQDNPHGHPHPETLEELRRHLPEDRILQTKDSGTIELVTDGTGLEVRTER